MTRRSDVKRRRAERIRAILESNRAAAGSDRSGKYGPSAPSDPSVPAEPSVQLPNPVEAPANMSHPANRSSMPSTPAMDSEPAERDPETEWKLRSREWLASSKGPLRGLIPDDPPPEPPRTGGGWVRDLAVKTAVSALLFAAVWGLFRLDEPWAEPAQQLIARALTRDMDTEAAAAWYRKTFAGSPSFIPMFRQENERPGGGPGLPVSAPVASGEVVRTFAETLAGIVIAGGPSETVTAAETGRVTHVSRAEEGYSVVIQHAGGRSTIYGRLRTVDVAPDDWVEAGDRIGALHDSPDGTRSLLYFAVRIDGKYVDPADVVPLD